MAYCKVGSHASASACLTYCEQKQGHEREGLVKSGVNCDIEYAKQEFRAVQVQWNKTDGIQAHTVIQSFDPKDPISPQQANEIGQIMAEKIAPGHQAAVYTHTDSDGGKIHNHIIFNAVSHETGKKLNTSGLLNKSRAISNELCLERGLSVIRERSAELRYTQAEQGLNKRKIDSWKDEVRQIVDDAKKQCRNPKEFEQYLGKYGIGMTSRGKEGKITYQHPNGKKVRASKLGDLYEKESINKALSLRVERTAPSRSVERPREIPKTLESVEKEKQRRIDAITKPEIEAERQAKIAKAAEMAKQQAVLAKQYEQEQQKVKKQLTIKSPSLGRGGMGR